MALWYKFAAVHVALLVGAGAATSKPAAPHRADDGLESIATIEDIMQNVVDASADALWASVASTTTASGTEDRQPQTEDDWKIVRRYAILLAEAPNLLLLPGRHVASVGGKLEGSNVKGILRPEEIEKIIVADRHVFIERAQALRFGAKEALAAIDARDVRRLFEAGGVKNGANH